MFSVKFSNFCLDFINMYDGNGARPTISLDEFSGDSNFQFQMQSQELAS